MRTWVSVKDEASSQCCQHGWETPEELVPALGSPRPIQGNGGNGSDSAEADSEGGWRRLRPHRVPGDAHSEPTGRPAQLPEDQGAGIYTKPKGYIEESAVGQFFLSL